MFRLICECSHQNTLEQIEGETLTLKNIHLFFKSFVCSKCKRKHLKVFHDGTLTIDSNNLILCESCSRPVIYQRYEICPEKICITCAEDKEKPKIPSPVKLPRIPEKYKKCPKGHYTEIRQNKETGEFFIGCSEFPKCFWTKAFSSK